MGLLRTSDLATFPVKVATRHVKQILCIEFVFNYHWGPHLFILKSAVSVRLAQIMYTSLYLSSRIRCTKTKLRFFLPVKMFNLRWNTIWRTIFLLMEVLQCLSFILLFYNKTYCVRIATDKLFCVFCGVYYYYV